MWCHTCTQATAFLTVVSNICDNNSSQPVEHSFQTDRSRYWTVLESYLHKGHNFSCIPWLLLGCSICSQLVPHSCHTYHSMLEMDEGSYLHIDHSSFYKPLRSLACSRMSRLAPPM